MLRGAIGQGPMIETKAERPGVLTVRDRLSTSLRDAEQRVDALRRLEELFEKHPEIEEAMTLLGFVGY